MIPTRCGQTLSTTIFLSILSLNSSRLSKRAIRTPLSGLENKDTTGPITTVVYSSSVETFLPSWRSKGTIEAANVEAPPRSRAETSAGRTRCVANSGGSEFADSFSILVIHWTGVGFSRSDGEEKDQPRTVSCSISQNRYSEGNYPDLGIYLRVDCVKKTRFLLPIPPICRRRGRFGQSSGYEDPG
jgi:hypothetical protein